MKFHIAIYHHYCTSLICSTALPFDLRCESVMYIHTYIHMYVRMCVVCPYVCASVRLGDEGLSDSP